MKSGLSFLLAAQQCEIRELEQLAATSELVSLLARFTHAVQRERGITNLYLASEGVRFADQRLQQAAECAAIEAQVRERFDGLDTEGHSVRNGARLFSRVAGVLHSLDGLAGVRRSIAAQSVTPKEATTAMVRVISGLLGVVFEAADSATDPEISRSLVALFNFMQGKEFAGQERAFGCAIFAAGRPDAGGVQQWQHLIDSQQACFQVFADFADFQVLEADRASVDLRGLAELERLRRIGFTQADGGRSDGGLAQVWYDCCTRRIDTMRRVEEIQAEYLRALCETKIAQARTELRDQRAMLEALAAQPPAVAGEAPMYGPQLERSILGMVQDQARRLQAMSDELDTVRASLNERKVVERAKGLLMAAQHLTEAEAYKALRQMAMNQNRRVVDVAENVLAMADVLPSRAR
ncbi:ANTAR domain-containing protein [Caenimonas sedimenti]|uniref:ANTAR domain-containing protein n=1 Tax=Caenimonas sedimenti TaxID=2596921 RepID=A0A562ZJQ0_9BURK|nr:nitrate regulatory protein [Caenimonas sedimenti]TWO68617.1 ANTAR domain-containing protein [Caenimonas sedimenti]